MERCKTCVWWQTPNHLQAMKEGRFCSAPHLTPHMNIDFRNAGLGDFPEGERLLKSDEAGIAAYDEGSLFTGPDFGCVHWKPQRDCLS